MTKHTKPIDPFTRAICPSCGWVGSPKSLARGLLCPRCKDYEGLVSLSQMISDDSLDEWNVVNMPVFLRALQDLGVLKREGE